MTLRYMEDGSYKTCPVSATTTLGATGAAGDYLDQLTIVPGTTGAGDVSIKDGADTAINVYKSGTLADLHSWTISIRAKSVTGAWQIVCGANVTALASGKWT